MDIWKGSLLGDLAKHRDYEHGGDYFSHAIDNGKAWWLYGDGEDEELVEYVDDAPEYPDEYDDEDPDEFQGSPKRVKLEIDPITGDYLESPSAYYVIVLRMGGKNYRYYIPEPKGGGTPSKEQISSAINRYIKSPWVDRSNIDSFIVD